MIAECSKLNRHVQMKVAERGMNECAHRVKDVYKHLFFDKVKSLGTERCLYEISKNVLVDDMKLWPPVTSPDMCTVVSSKRRETLLGNS